MTKQYLRRATENLPDYSSGAAVVFSPIHSAAGLAPMMLAAYLGTPDYEGEDLAATEQAITDAMAGCWGDWIAAASFAAVVDDEPVGAIFMVEGESEPYIAFVFTHPEYQGRGIAAALIVHAIEALGISGRPSVGLYVSKDNARALALYRQLGFAPVD